MAHFFKAMKEHEIKDHPGVKALVALGGLLGDAACDLKLDGKQTLCTDRSIECTLRIFFSDKRPLYIKEKVMFLSFI